MTTSFEERLARLDAKQPDAAIPPPPSPPKQRGTSGGPKGPSGGGGTLKMIALGLGFIIALPVAAFFGTTYLAKNAQTVAAVSEGASTLATGAQLLGVMYAPSLDTERRDARRLRNDVFARMKSEDMSKEEGEYWASYEGQRELAELQKKSMNFDKIKAVAAKQYGTD